MDWYRWIHRIEIPNFSPNIYEYFYRPTAMNSIEVQCTDLKKKYDACYSIWFTDHFLKGNTDESMCAPLFKMYQQCLKDGLKERNIKLKEIENSEFELEKNSYQQKL